MPQAALALALKVAEMEMATTEAVAEKKDLVRRRAEVG